ncbi:MAG: hypothetical protein WC476_01485 [Phycisphaerae bacterium]|jgi:hypothetical protein
MKKWAVIYSPQWRLDKVCFTHKSALSYLENLVCGVCGLKLKQCEMTMAEYEIMTLEEYYKYDSIVEFIQNSPRWERIYPE